MKDQLQYKVVAYNDQGEEFSVSPSHLEQDAIFTTKEEAERACADMKTALPDDYTIKVKEIGM
ncbi:hypothetical protein [Bacillus sp. FJAT-44742]|uniref:hypothetical protein n=1 Tax=Bacillus sp. FJAT-44742 TaxID=2014005 RepID=UPI000C24B04D|nr:hypothetical protein [Bacillus sp. FJAT-44742]